MAAEIAKGISGGGECWLIAGVGDMLGDRLKKRLQIQSILSTFMIDVKLINNLNEQSAATN